MQNQSYLNLLLILVSCFAFLPIGRLFRIRGAFASMLVGVGVSGLIISILANFCAALIRPVVIAMIVFSLIIFVKDYKSYKFRDNRPMYIVLSIFALILFVLNNPIGAFIKNQTLMFNPHYSYYASQAIEMLNAHYFSRLKVAQFFPLEWGRYHFFNASVQASAQALIAHPNLLSYFFAQLVLGVLGFLAIIESFYLDFKFNLKNLIISVVWLVIGFSLFANSITWNLMTTGAFSVPAMVLLLISIYRKNLVSFVIFALILGASAFRLMPLALVAILLLFVYQFGRLNALALGERLVKTVRSLVPSAAHFFAVVFFLLYGSMTMALGKPNEGSRLALANMGNFFHEGWSYPLASYKIVGLLNHLEGKQHFLKYAFDGYINANLNHRLLAILLGLFFVVTFLFLLRLAYQYFRSQAAQIFTFLPIVFLFVIPFCFAPLTLKSLFVLTIPYLVIFLALSCEVQNGKTKVNKLSSVYIWLFSIAVLLQLSPLSVEVKIPILYIICDVALWGILGLFMFSRINKTTHIIAVTVMSILLVPIFGLHVKDMLVIKPSSSVVIKEVLKEKDFRSGFVFDKTNMCDFSFEDPATVDAYSVLIGCDLNSSEKNTSFMSYGFVDEKK